MSQKQIHNSGQSLLEVVMVAFILVMALVALISLTTVSISRNRLAKERTVATRLAQEGLEWFKYERDRVGFDAVDLALGETGDTFCLSELPDGGITLLTTECGGNNFVLVGTNASLFQRRIERLDSALDDEVKIAVVVEYRGKSVSLEGLVTKWQ